MSYQIVVTIDWPGQAQRHAVQLVERALSEYQERELTAQRAGHLGCTEAEAWPERVHVGTADGLHGVEL